MLDNLETDFPENSPRAINAPLALGGIRIVDFTHFIAGPLATMILADMGADVIKVEAPVRGDDFRQYPPFDKDIGLAAPFLWSNRNKRSVALDLKSAQGLAIVQQLIATADVVVENFSTGVMDRLGLDYGACLKLNPKLVYCSISAYGRSGEFSDRVGFDPIAQAESGFISMNGYADRDGVRALSPVMDISTAMMASNAILGALLARERTGEGQELEVSLFDNAVFMTGYATLQHVFTGEEPARHGNTSPDTCPSGMFHAQDRSFYINCGSNKIFARLMVDVLDRPDVAAEPRYATGAGRSQCRDELFQFLNEEFARQPWVYWQERMRSAGVPCGLVRTVGEAIRSEEARERELVTRIQTSDGKWVPNMALPIRYGVTPLADPVVAPTVGQHNSEILRDVLGYDDADLQQFAEAGAFGEKAKLANTTAEA